jgi:hypothetical protein
VVHMDRLTAAVGTHPIKLLVGPFDPGLSGFAQPRQLTRRNFFLKGFH